MSQQSDSFKKTFRSNAAIPQFSRVKIASAGTVGIAGLTEPGDGFCQDEVLASGVLCTVKLHGAPSQKVIAKEAFSVGATLYSEAGGKMQDTAESTSKPMMRALEAATAENDIVEAVYLYGEGAAA